MEKRALFIMLQTRPGNYLQNRTKTTSYTSVKSAKPPGLFPKAIFLCNSNDKKNTIIYWRIEGFKTSFQVYHRNGADEKRPKPLFCDQHEWV